MMPSTSPAQKKLMAIAAHTPGGYGGISQSVGKEFHNVDTGKYGHIDDNKRKIAKALIKK
jgi:hypothetical protein